MPGTVSTNVHLTSGFLDQDAAAIPRFMSEKSGLSLMFAVLVDASASRRGVKVMAAISRQLDGLRKDSGSNRAFREAA